MSQMYGLIKKMTQWRSLSKKSVLKSLSQNGLTRNAYISINYSLKVVKLLPNPLLMYLGKIGLLGTILLPLYSPKLVGKSAWVSLIHPKKVLQELGTLILFSIIIVLVAMSLIKLRKTGLDIRKERK